MISIFNSSTLIRTQPIIVYSPEIEPTSYHPNIYSMGFLSFYSLSSIVNDTVLFTEFGSNWMIAIRST